MMKTKRHRFVITASFLILLLSAFAFGEDTITINARKRIPSEDAPGTFRIISQKQQWKSSETAIIICDMWDQHWCKGATDRVGQMAPAMNNVVSIARHKGILILHAPSSCMETYKDHPARKNAQNAPKTSLPDHLKSWCNKIETENNAAWPIDQADGGCDCKPQCRQHSPWKSQIDTIKIDGKDFITDSGIETGSILQANGIKNVIVMGVHTNMCVIGRPFGLRNMAKFGKNVVLMRDMTDTMYNSRRSPYVNHFTGTSLIVEYIEKNVCPTIASTDLTGNKPFRFPDDRRPKIVFMIAEREYHTDQRLPEFARILENKHNMHCDFALGISKASGPERNSIENTQTIADADLLIVSVRRRALPDWQMKYLTDHLDAKKPLIAIRTSSHAFDAKKQIPDPENKGRFLAQWLGFDSQVLGCNYNGHYGTTTEGTKIDLLLAAKSHPILKDLNPAGFKSEGTLYRSAPLTDKTTALLTGSISGQAPEPVAWTNTYRGAKIFATSLAHWNDWPIEDFEKLMINAISWALD